MCRMYFLGECFLYALGLHVLVSNTLIVVYVMGFFDALMVGWMAAWLAGWVGGVGGWVDGLMDGGRNGWTYV